MRGEDGPPPRSCLWERFKGTMAWVDTDAHGVEGGNVGSAPYDGGDSLEDARSDSIRERERELAL